MIIKQKNFKLFNIEHDFIHDIFLNNDKIVLIGNNQYKKTIDLDNIQILNIHDKIKKIETYQDTKPNDFFIKTYYLNEIYNEIIFTVNFKFNQYCELNHKLKLHNISLQLKNFDLTNCITTVLNTKDINESIFYDWYNYYNEIGITTFIIYYTDNLNTLNNCFLDFVNKQKKIIVFEWSFINEAQRNINNRLEFINHCTNFIKNSSLLVCNCNDFLYANNVVELDEHCEKNLLPGYYLNNIFTYYQNDKLLIYNGGISVSELNYFINPSLFKTNQELNLFLNFKINNKHLYDNYFYNSHLINYTKYIYKNFKDKFKKNLEFNEINRFRYINKTDYLYYPLLIENMNNDSVITDDLFFKPYQYFIENKEIIKKKIFTHNELIEIQEIKNKINSFHKKTMCIHIHFSDFSEILDYHTIPTIEYYKKAIHNYNISNYKIFLISNDINKAKNIIKPLNLQYTLADTIYFKEKQQFYMLMLADVHIGANSSFSLMASYLNDIYNFNNKAEYIFPHKWFGNAFSKYNIFDIIPIDNKKYNFIQEQKCAVIFFHKNIQKIYKQNWTDKCVNSIINQKRCYFDVFEINYGDENYSIFSRKQNFLENREYMFFKKNYKTHNEAMLFLLNYIFINLEYDIVFNTNLDDYYNEYRFIYQYLDITNNNNYINSTLWTYIKENNFSEDKILESNNKFLFENNDFVWRKLNNIEDGNYKELIPNSLIKKHILNKNNCLNHSGICFSKLFWNSIDIYGNKLTYRNDKPYEDLGLWIRAIQNNIPISVINKNLIYYRIHDQQIGTKNKNKKILTKEEVKEFKTGPDLRKIRKGLLIMIDKKEDIVKLEIKQFDYYFLYINQKISKFIIHKLENSKNYMYYSLIEYDKNLNETISLCEIKNKFSMQIELNCDKLYMCDILKEKYENIKIKYDNKIIFYSVFYNLKSKFNFTQYIDWFYNYKHFLNNYKVVMITNIETKNLINKYAKDLQFEFIIKELETFELFNYKELFIKNLKYFPYHTIDWKVLLLYVNRHFFIKDIKKKYNSEYYSYLDIGYFRYIDPTQKYNINLDNLNKDRIYLGKINNQNNEVIKIEKIFIDLSKYQLEPLLKDIHLIGGGGNIIHNLSVKNWLRLYKQSLDEFLTKDIDFKDDQPILINMFLKNKNLFKLIYGKVKNDTWFPFINYLQNKDFKEIEMY